MHVIEARNQFRSYCRSLGTRTLHTPVQPLSWRSGITVVYFRGELRPSTLKHEILTWNGGGWTVSKAIVESENCQCEPYQHQSTSPIGRPPLPVFFFPQSDVTHRFAKIKNNSGSYAFVFNINLI